MPKRLYREELITPRESLASSAPRSKARKTRLDFEVSSGNVFADLGFPDAEELDFKLALAVQVIRRIDARGLSLTSAAVRGADVGVYVTPSDPDVIFDWKIIAHLLSSGLVFSGSASFSSIKNITHSHRATLFRSCDVVC